LLDALAPDQIATFRDHLAEGLQTGAAEVLRKVQTTGELGEADKGALLAELRKLAASLGTPDV
jgi:F-type H+-transporting ATPase subunit alpha